MLPKPVQPFTSPLGVVTSPTRGNEIAQVISAALADRQRVLNMFKCSTTIDASVAALTHPNHHCVEGRLDLCCAPLTRTALEAVLPIYFLICSVSLSRFSPSIFTELFSVGGIILNKIILDLILVFKNPLSRMNVVALFTVGKSAVFTALIVREVVKGLYRITAQAPLFHVTSITLFRYTTAMVMSGEAINDILEAMK
jgi:hypothetical protein